MEGSAALLGWPEYYVGSDSRASGQIMSHLMLLIIDL